MPHDLWSLERREVAAGKGSPAGIVGRYSGSLLFVVLSHSMLSSLWVGDGRAPGPPVGRILSPWKRLHSGQMRMWLHPLATRAASCASLWERGSGSPVPPHSFPLLRLTAAARARRSSRGKGRGRSIDAARRRLACRLSRHRTIPWSSRSISSHTDCCKHTHGKKTKIGQRGIREGEKEREARQLTDYGLDQDRRSDIKDTQQIHFRVMFIIGKLHGGQRIGWCRLSGQQWNQRHI